MAVIPNIEWTKLTVREVLTQLQFKLARITIKAVIENNGTKSIKVL